MKIFQENYLGNKKWQSLHSKEVLHSANLVLCFGDKNRILKENLFPIIKARYPTAEIIISSTSGEISDQEVFDQTIVLTAIEFEHTQLETCKINIRDFADSYQSGLAIVDQLCRKDLSHVFIISDGQFVNGSELVRGLNNFRCKNMSITGGLAGDGFDFNSTIVGLNEIPHEGGIVAIGFYGNRLKVGYGSKGGWDAFGPERLVTKSDKNILYELDGISALDLYKKYLGEAAKELPSSALFFPLSIRIKDDEDVIVRTILSVNEKDQSMIFAGDIPEQSLARLMMHNSNKLVEGAERAAQQSLQNFDTEKPDLAILISCVGRKIVLGQSVDEEIETIRDLMGTDTAITGFYSYGEIAPSNNPNHCQLHNQTMTVTTMTEI